MNLSKFGEKFTNYSGILQLMDDLGDALSGRERMLMMGGGNPAQIPAVQARFKAMMQEILDSPGEFERMVGNYSNPQGDAAFLEALAGFFRRECGWDVSSKNIALTNGSQTAFFSLFNMFAGDFAAGPRRKILFPLAPEYIGYADVGLNNDFLIANKPEIEYIDAHTFKYHINFRTLTITDDIGAICISRPTNPTGNVLTEQEVTALADLARRHNIPLIIDNAYGTPFPNIIFINDVKPVWNETIILSMSLSKLGLPAARTGIVLAREAVITAVSRINAISGLAPGSIGAALVRRLVESGEIATLSNTHIRPFYRRRAEMAAEQLKAELDGYDFYIHKPEGAIFLWLWFKNMPITSQELYERLKARKALVVPSHYFFPGLQEEWRHKDECIRVTYCQDEAIVREGLHIIAEEVKKAYA